MTLALIHAGELAGGSDREPDIVLRPISSVEDEISLCGPAENRLGLVQQMPGAGGRNLEMTNGEGRGFEGSGRHRPKFTELIRDLQLITNGRETDSSVSQGQVSWFLDVRMRGIRSGLHMLSK